MVVLLALNLGSVFLLSPAGPLRVKVPFSPYFVSEVQAGGVASIATTGDAMQGTFKSAVRYPPATESATATKLFATEVPTFWNNDQLAALLQAHDVQINAQSTVQTTSLLSSLLLGFGPDAADRRDGRPVHATRGQEWRRDGRAQQLRPLEGAAGRSGEHQGHVRRRRRDRRGQVRADRDRRLPAQPTRYGRLGGRMPHGVLLSGAPGTGKTLLARAVAGEAHAAFFSISASEFIEAIVGVGASRVRDLFTKAKEAAPSIIFIDELDAIGRSRQGSVSLAGANDEREQTLNQILTELDGFEPAEAVIVLAATNRPEILDPALLRPGRFDRRVAVQPPDRLGRRQILEVHTRSIPLADGVDLEALAASTPGMVGADLANLANEAALLAARRNHHTVQTADFTDSLEKILLGAPARDRPVSRRPRANGLPRSGSRPGRDAHPRR